MTDQTAPSVATLPNRKDFTTPQHMLDFIAAKAEQLGSLWKDAALAIAWCWDTEVNHSKSLNQLLAEHGRADGWLAEAERRLGELVSSLESKFLPVATWTEFRAELDSSLSKWCEQAFQALEDRALGVVRSELERFKATMVPADPPEPESPPTPPEPEPPTVPDPAAPEPTAEARAAEHVDPLSLARDAFPTLQEFTQIGYYADTYEHRKAEWEARKAAASAPAPEPEPATNGEENSPADSATGA